MAKPKPDGFPAGGKSGRGRPSESGWESPRGTHVHRRGSEPKHDGYPLGKRGDKHK